MAAWILGGIGVVAVSVSLLVLGGEIQRLCSHRIQAEHVRDLIDIQQQRDRLESTAVTLEVQIRQNEADLNHLIRRSAEVTRPRPRRVT